MRLTENHIRQLHQSLLRHSDKDERHRGSYKTLSNNVVALDADGREIGVVFETTSPFDTPREMEALVAWTRKALDEEALHPLAVIAVFIVTFLAIHPFQDGNGRLSRVLTTLLLLRAGYAYVPYASLERVIEENKDLYYRALRRTQTTLERETPDWEPWVGFFLRCLKKQKDTLAARLDRERIAQGSEADLPELSLQVLESAAGERAPDDRAACIDHRRESEHAEGASARAGRRGTRAAARQGARHLVFAVNAEPPTIDQVQLTGSPGERRSDLVRLMKDEIEFRLEGAAAVPDNCACHHFI